MVFFFNDTATTEIYTLSLHDALPISSRAGQAGRLEPNRAAGSARGRRRSCRSRDRPPPDRPQRSGAASPDRTGRGRDRKSTRLNSSHANISYAVFCLKKKKKYYTLLY